MSDVSEGAVYLCNNLYTPTNTNYGATSMLCTGATWDSMLDFIKDSSHSVTNSTTWGNYSNYNTANNYTEGTAGYEKNAGSLQNTGSSENWKANNIYDLAGNVEEWTQEANNTDSRACRGGDYFGSFGSSKPASSRFGDYPGGSDSGALRFSSYFNNKVTLDSRA